MSSAWHPDWFLSGILNHHINQMVDRYSALLALRIDLSYKKDSIDYQQPDHHQLEHDVRKLMDDMMLYDAVVGYFWVLEYGEERRYHAHVVLWLDRHYTLAPFVYAEYAKKYWECITLQDGIFHRCGHKPYYSANISIPVNYSNPMSVDNIRRVLSYLTKEEQKWTQPIYGCNEVSEHSEQGRPRNPGVYRYTSPYVRYCL
ncbi:inovirus Gp2 family protein [Salmonella enterica]|nr:inovirus Gp2 family protein [Salmonella enterica subsp. salamae]ECL1288125.1 inovirus Gp2 family protein [Salmonella enterica]ECJ2729153.1 inovirus Gp2 family protein [Salmonella enterica subsp. salamae]EEA0957373.1 inovirus Gp2 family protein [Salmonella enterica]EGH5308839.1 inovirus Gp2 family protein [Salmonella enterica]